MIPFFCITKNLAFQTNQDLNRRSVKLLTCHLFKMLEIAVRMELQAKSGELVESLETDSADISFEELLAQEKKDSFW